MEDFDFITTKDMEDISHRNAYTTDEIRQNFLREIRRKVKYWAAVDDKNTNERLDGLAFSILSMLDGGVDNIPPFIVTPISSEEKRIDAIQNGQKYYVGTNSNMVTNDIAGILHEQYYNKY
jgi:hypothetical protein